MLPSVLRNSSLLQGSCLFFSLFTHYFGNLLSRSVFIEAFFSHIGLSMPRLFVSDLKIEAS